jgi:hypothetical protein
LDSIRHLYQTSPAQEGVENKDLIRSTSYARKTPLKPVNLIILDSGVRIQQVSQANQIVFSCFTVLKLIRAFA